MKKLENIDTRPAKAKFLKKIIIAIFTTTYQIVWTVMRTTLLIVAAILPGVSSIVFPDDSHEEEECTTRNTPNWTPITTKSGNVKFVMEGTSEEYDNSDF